jgi:hypothetical protein
MKGWWKCPTVVTNARGPQLHREDLGGEDLQPFAGQRRLHPLVRELPVRPRVREHHRRVPHALRVKEDLRASEALRAGRTRCKLSHACLR